MAKRESFTEKESCCRFRTSCFCKGTFLTLVVASYIPYIQVLNAFVPFIFRDIINMYNDKAPEFLKLSMDSPVAAIAGVGISLIIACETIHF